MFLHKMVSITLSVPEDVRKTMKEFPEINWSGLIRGTIEEKAKMLVLKQQMLKELDKEKDFIDWSVDLGRKAKRGRLKRFNKK